MTKKFMVITGIFAASLIGWVGTSASQSGARGNRVMVEDDEVETPYASAAEPEDSMSPKDRRMLKAAMNMAAECTAAMNRWLSSNEISEDKLFSYLYYPIENSNPTKFTTDYDQLSDRDIQSIVDKYLTIEPNTIYAVMNDKNGYIPTHNTKYSQPLSGNLEQDLKNSRSKRIFANKSGLEGARFTGEYLMQTFTRDTGQVVSEMSVPIFVNKRHWGGIGIGYLRE